jgi:hypothetical protein
VSVEHSRLQTPLADTSHKCAKVSAWWTGHGPYTSALFVSHTAAAAAASSSSLFPPRSSKAGVVDAVHSPAAAAAAVAVGASHTQQPATVSISYTPSVAAARRRSDGASGGEDDAAAHARDDSGWEVAEGAEAAGMAQGGQGEVQRSERTLWARTFGRLRLFRAHPQVCSS